MAVHGMCHICGKSSTFKVDFLYSDPDQQVDGQRIPNWREQLLCRFCRLNSRIRSAIHFLETVLHASPQHRLYITEQLTPLYEQLAKRYPDLTGSEYLGETIPYGTTDRSMGVRNESLTKLTFPDDTFDYLLSFDVLEHIPDYRDAARECHRCLKAGGTLLFSVPFDANSETNTVRATIDEAGEVKHLLPPEFHGDPVRDEGLLCFYHFGWELLDELRSLGFSSVAAHFLWSGHFMYLGNGQVLFKAVKPADL